MADFLTTKNSLAQIERIIQTAERVLTIITPFVQISDDFARRLRDADHEGTLIRLVCRTADLTLAQKRILTGFDNLTVYDDAKLHAKCFINERGVVLTSLNFYQASEQNNEMGVYLDAKEDRAAYQDAVREADSIIKSAEEFPLPQEATKRNAGARAPKSVKKKPSVKERLGFGRGGARKKVKSAGGHCIRCRSETDYNPRKPYCMSCFRQWSRYSNPSYADNHCHGCGAEEAKAFSLEKPECYSCYKRNGSKKAA